MKTTSAYLRSPWQVELREIELPDTPAAEEVLIRVEACGICGTDLTTAAEKAKNWQAFGHEIAGVIEAVGPGCKGLQKGDQVVLESSSFCGRCELCRNGRVDLCNKAPNFWGREAMGFSEYMIAPACCVVPYEGISPKVASLAEPAGVALDLVKTADIQLGDRVCLVGPGPIGLMAIPIAFRSGASQVVCIGRTRNGKRLETAEQLGAEVFAIDESLLDRKEHHRQFDHVLLTAPAKYIPEALSLLAYGGRLSYIGIGSGDGTIQFDANDFHYRKLQLRASFASPALYYPAVLQLLKAGVIPGDKIISHCMDLAEIDHAMTMHRENKDKTVKIVIRPNSKNVK